MLNGANRILWGVVLTGLLVYTGSALTVKTRFFQFRKFGEMLRESLKMFKKSDGISPFEAMSAALSGTMGTGNIIGVGAAIALGGPGALFWMIISALLSMIIKFAEVSLAVKYRVRKNGAYVGGAMYCITGGIGQKYKPIANLFCIATVLSSFGIGAAAQSAAVSCSLYETANANSAVIGLLLAVAAACVIIGKASRITKFTSVLVPIMTLTYFVGAAFALISYRENIIPSLGKIVSGAFGANAAGGGVCGALICEAARHGFSKGMFTNEAGMGSAPIVHASANNTPQRQGLLGMFEVFLDTIVMCTLTGLVILVTGCENLSGSVMTLSAFSRVFGSFGGIFIAICITLFAFGAIIGWSYYGAACCEYLFGARHAVTAYKVAYILAIILGAMLPVSFIIELSDLLNAFMALPNLYAVNRLSNDVREIANGG